jgi:predicted metal-dependent hydrolase
MSTITLEKKPEAKIRKVNFIFEKPFPKHWFNDNPIATHFMNAQHLAFPDGEKFFIRSVKAFADVYKNDPELKKRVDNFIGQEGTHYAEHQKFWDIMESQDLKPMGFVDYFRRTAWNGAENWARTALKKNRFGDKMALSVTVALEHFTAMLAESGITNKEISEKMPQEMQDLFMWHAAEEIEHKAIPFDVLKKVDDSYAIRVGGMVIASIGLWYYLAYGTVYLTRTDEDVQRKDIPKHAYEFLNNFRKNFGGTLSSQFWQYFRKDFHPDQIDNYHLAEELLKNKNYA